MVFQYDWKPVLIQRYKQIGLEAILEKKFEVVENQLNLFKFLKVLKQTFQVIFLVWISCTFLGWFKAILQAFKALP